MSDPVDLELTRRWLKGTAISHAMVTLTWLWPLCETLHFVGLALLMGVLHPDD